MAGEAGFAYETKINKLLKGAGIQDKSFRGARADKDAPDGEFEYQGTTYKVEIKLDLKVDFGQGSLDYDAKKKRWYLSGSSTEAGRAMREFLCEVGVPEMVNRSWGSKGPPRKGTVPLEKFKKEDVLADYKRFTEKKVDVATDAIAKYYATKKTYYIQIGGKGLYYMGQDPAKLGCPEFRPQTILRMRLKRGHSLPIYSYRFSTALRVPRLQDSTVNLENKDDLKAIAARAKS